MKVAVVGAGYVGLSISVLLAQKNHVVVVDVVSEKVNMINQGIPPVSDEYIQRFLAERKLHLAATTDYRKALSAADYVVVATPTDYDEHLNCFDTTAVDIVIRQVQEINPNAIVVIKSTVPLGYTEKMYAEGYRNVLFSPEFLREGKALYDNLYPSRIIVGYPGNNEELADRARRFAEILSENAETEDVPVMVMKASEAEAVKLFSNTYLAMRVAFFNELDTYAEQRELNAKAIIDGVCMDSRIGNYYNNPSFGYGGYCLPKDTKQLLANYADVPNELVKAVVVANKTRKDYIAGNILAREADTIGIYRLTMKAGSDNYRQSAVLDIIKTVQGNGKRIVIYEPTCTEKEIFQCEVVNEIERFKRLSDLIVTNRNDAELDDVRAKVYTRDLFFRD